MQSDPLGLSWRTPHPIPPPLRLQETPNLRPAFGRGPERSGKHAEYMECERLNVDWKKLRGVDDFVKFNVMGICETVKVKCGRMG